MPNLFHFNVKSMENLYSKVKWTNIAAFVTTNQQIYLTSKSKNCMQNAHFRCGMYGTALKVASYHQCQGMVLLHYK